MVGKPESYTKLGVAATSLKHFVKGALGALHQTDNDQQNQYIHSSVNQDPLNPTVAFDDNATTVSNSSQKVNTAADLAKL